ncbi:2,3-bisphosphoglycerate-independent phosphoglycerate mutase [Owenweeksia hongkongensis DSM 17368]|uniref:2,3-bisphosphoglycerate-independent phosphoglycerate mutase n=1 Tax=Owenweeksia hongkongensis (strain DSM 17368 / CIP 108786 / JCM 12287 / NRRL B-23963 / UST20020801) TaxID=926562 RepID=G8R351_OWEHD|nr:2,3-bisphosphoglycerate-independent phosphoglycerate mutase [Owenweeksia hongkongensis]AEV34076.1 2,3-bisphosphoglycerate-independent phosphoglycerate mutase [Owenweeksia hongkongensis DSM 17368]
MSRKTALIILDGWGIAKDPSVSAIDKANTPFVDSLYTNYPHSQLEASGLAVGLPEGQMGNSEVGHMNLGAGRVVYQDLVKINLGVEDGSLTSQPVLQDAFEYAKTNRKKVHFIGLLSDGGVHSHINHLKGLTTAAAEKGLKDVKIHVFTDGRDTDPKGGAKYVADLENHLEKTTGKIASVIGRYYAMDRDKRWERVKLAYDLLVNGVGETSNSATEAIQASYDAGISDEFIKPIVIDKAGMIEEGDVVICYNFRTDRGRQITEALTQQDFHEQNMHKLDLYYVTMTRYDDTFKNIKVIYEKDNLTETMGEVLAKAGKKQIRIAETEKYPHVTFFFSGGREEEFEGEKRIMRSSPKVATYDLKPEMSAYELRDAIIPELKKGEVDFICLNFANPDMVGHTGVMEAAIKACEVVDECTKDVVEAGLKNDYTFIIIADHGNSDCMVNADGSPNTAHTTQPVPCFLVSNDYKGKIGNGKLGDVAPTLLELMDIAQPESMTGVSFLIK